MAVASILDVELRKDPDGKIARKIIELQTKTDPALMDMKWEKCNDGTTHLTTVRTGIPEGTWRQLYQGVDQSKSTTAQVRDATGMLEMRSRVDVKLPGLRGGGEPAREFRFSEEAAFRQGLKNDVMATWLYGDQSVAPAKFTGVMARFNTRNTALAATAEHVIHGGGSGLDNCSILIHTWGDNYGKMIFPEHSNAGLSVRDLGEDDVLDENGKPFRALQSLYGWDLGYSLGDWRGVVRIANIDVSELTKTGSTGADLVDLITQGLELLPDEAFELGNVVIYVPKIIRSYLRRQMVNKDNLQLHWDELFGKKVLHCDGVPIRRLSSLVTNESLVAA